MSIISYQEWMTQTRSSFSRRSSELKKIDSALEFYHQREQERRRLQGRSQERSQGQVQTKAAPGGGNKLCQLQRMEDIRRLHKALSVWMRSKSNYRDSVRNKQGTVERLVQQVASELRHSEPEQQAFAQIVQARDETLKQMLADKQLVSRSFLHSNLRRKSDAFNLARAPLTIRKIIQALTKDAFGEDIIVNSSINQGALTVTAGPLSQMLKIALEELVEELKQQLIEAMPLIGTAASFSQAIYSAGKIVQKDHSQQVLIRFGNRLPRGDSRMAINACNHLLEREIASLQVKGMASLISAAAGLANLMSGGSASALSAHTSLAKSIVSLIDRLYAIGVDYREAKKANEMIKNGQLDRDIFAVCPVLGAYYLVEASTSDIALFFVNIGGPAWMDDVEQLKKSQLDPVIKRARRLVQDSRYRLVPKSGGKLKADLKPV